MSQRPNKSSLGKNRESVNKNQSSPISGKKLEDPPKSSSRKKSRSGKKASLDEKSLHKQTRLEKQSSQNRKSDQLSKNSDWTKNIKPSTNDQQISELAEMLDKIKPPNDDNSSEYSDGSEYSDDSNMSDSESDDSSGIDAVDILDTLNELSDSTTKVEERILLLSSYNARSYEQLHQRFDHISESLKVIDSDVDSTHRCLELLKDQMDEMIKVSEQRHLNILSYLVVVSGIIFMKKDLVVPLNQSHDISIASDINSEYENTTSITNFIDDKVKKDIVMSFIDSMDRDQLIAMIQSKISGISKTEDNIKSSDDLTKKEDPNTNTNTSDNLIGKDNSKNID